MASIEFDIDDILNSLMRWEKQSLADELYDDGYCPKQLDGAIKVYKPKTDFDLQVEKLIGNKWRLTKEDEETILRIAAKLI